MVFPYKKAKRAQADAVIDNNKFATINVATWLLIKQRNTQN
jgi:hypothetical protein